MSDPCKFDAAIGGQPHGLRCGKPTVAVCYVRDEPNKLKRVCEDHLNCYKPHPYAPHPYITWYERDIYSVIEDHDMGDV
jgi:hypothetical protein